MHSGHHCASQNCITVTLNKHVTVAKPPFLHKKLQAITPQGPTRHKHVVPDYTVKWTLGLLTCAVPPSTGDDHLFDQAQQIVKRVHECGVIHQDLACRNWIVAEEGVQKTLYLIDFSHSVLSYDPRRRKQDLIDLDDLRKYL